MEVVMVIQLDRGHDTGSEEDLGLRDRHARSTARPGWYAAIVVMNVLAIVAFMALVVVPRLT